MDTIKLSAVKPKMIAHRGMSGLERENTCAAFVAAGNRSHFGIETDVHVTRDGKFVIIHDETTERVTGGAHNVNVETSDYAALEALVLPDIDGTTVRKDIRIPLLSEYIKICKKYEKTCVLEVKNHFSENDLRRMIDEIESLNYSEHMIFISFDAPNCFNLRSMLPNAQIQLLTDAEVTDELAAVLLEHRLDLDIYYKRLSAETVHALHAKGIRVNCWTCDNAQEAAELAYFGVDYITSNILE